MAEPLVEVRRRTVGRFLHDKRVKAGLTQWVVAAHLKYGTAQFISNWERGISLPPLNALPKLAKLLGVSGKAFVSVIADYEEAAMALRMKEVKARLKGVR